MPSTNGHDSKLERIALYPRVSSEEQRGRERIEELEATAQKPKKGAQKK